MPPKKSKGNPDGPTPAPQISTPSSTATAAERGLPPPDTDVITHHSTPASRIQEYKEQIEAEPDSPHRINYEAFIRYYEEGNRCPQGFEELWAINGVLYWGIKRMPEDFPGNSRWDASPKFCEVC